MRTTIKLMHQWQFLYKKSGWYEFNFIKVFIEDTRWFGILSIEVWLLGFGFEVVWNYHREGGRS